MGMIKNGQEINYLDWYTPEDPLRELTAAGMDDYFRDNNGDPNEIVPGTPVVGYRFMYKDTAGNYHSPFFNQSLQEAEARHPGIDVKALAGLQDADAGSTILNGQVNVDPTGRGFYYWPDQGIAEDYMKTFFSRGKELNKIHDSVVIVESTTERDNTFGERVNRFLGTGHMPPKHEVRQLPSLARYLKPGETEESVSERSTRKRGKNTIHTSQHLETYELGTFELVRVTGTAVPNLFGDAGYTMNEMEISSDPIISVPANEAYDTVQKWLAEDASRTILSRK